MTPAVMGGCDLSWENVITHHRIQHTTNLWQVYKTSKLESREQNQKKGKDSKNMSDFCKNIPKSQVLLK